jgi:hypothetical protein
MDNHIYRGEIVYRDDKTIRLRLANEQTICITLHGIMLIKDLGWRKIKKGGSY